MDRLTEYYNKFNEEKRLLRPYGRVEYLTTMKYIHDFIGERKNLEILDVGAGTGRYAVPLSQEGHAVTAVEPVNYNLGILKQKKSGVNAFHGNALRLKKCPSEHYDIVLELGPMYHLFTEDDRIQALLEAKRVLKKDGILFTAWCMNEYAVLIHGFREGAVKASLENGKLNGDFHVNNTEEDLYSFVRISDIDRLNEAAGLKRVKILSSDGPANYMRKEITAMDEETFSLFMDYHLKTCEYPELLGAGGHILDILTK